MTTPGAKIRVHMGCGEPLKSRSWITRAMTVLMAVEEKPATTVDVQAEPRREGRRKP